MKRTIYLLLILIFSFSCRTDSKKSTKIRIEDNSSKPSNVENKLNFERFKESTWVDGEIGENGEKPDTLIFITKDSLLFIGNEPITREMCPYHFKSDTLIFTDHGTVNDKVDPFTEKTCAYLCKLQFKDKVFKYVSIDRRIITEKTWEHFDYRNNNLAFRRIK